MHWNTRVRICASISALAIATTAQAQSQTSAQGAYASSATGLDEIVVTARRKEESLQDVPQVVNALPAETLDRLAIKDFRDIQTVVPGLNFEGSQNASLRGVSFNSNTSSQATVAFYLNDTLVQQGQLLQVMFDVGQIEVLRGPQGTNRGVSAPSGAITLTTKRPDLTEFGGYVDVLLNDQDRRYINGAINVPIISDVLALRVAGASDRNEGNGVRSYFSTTKPSVRTDAVRASLRFEPSEDFSAVVMYQHITRNSEQFDQLFGPGFPGQTPSIGALDRRAVADKASTLRSKFDVVTAQADWNVLGHRVSYVGGWSRQKSDQLNDSDNGQILIGPSIANLIHTNLRYISQELRISSDPAPGRFLDYTVGGFYRDERMQDDAFNRTPALFLNGAFGSVTAPNVAAYDPQYQIPQFIPTASLRREKSLFASFTAHLTPNTELTAGIRHLWIRNDSFLKIQLESGLGLTLGGLCPSSLQAPNPGPTPGTCSSAPTIVTVPPRSFTREQDTVYNVSLSHKITPDLLVYANYGTAYRPPYSSIGIQNGLNDPVLNGLLVHPSEHSKTYEVGFKGTFFDGRARLNIAYFHQKFKDLPTFVPNIRYLANTGAPGAASTLSNFSFTADPDAVVDGVDVDAWFRLTPRWTFSAQASWAKGRVASGSGLPCNDGNFDGTPDSIPVTSVAQFPAGVKVAICPGGNISQLPRWNATFQSEYTLPVTDKVDAYLRGLFNYFPKNPYATQARVIDNYGLLNLFLGARANDGAWEVGLYARNILNTQKITQQGLNQLTGGASNIALYRPLQRSTGYFSVDQTPKQEFGVTMRYAFGSR
ncbi:MAG TPA: TonB-dependent receptor [Novosphingobium sp.]